MSADQPLPTRAAPAAAELMDTFARAAGGYYRCFGATAAHEGLTLMQGKVLELVRSPTPMRALADILGCDASNVTGIVDRLEARGLVRRGVDPADRRVRTVELTEDGRDVAGRITERMMAHLPGLAAMGEGDRASLSALLGRIVPASH